MLNYYNDKKFINYLNVLWNYLQLDQKLEPCDVIIGCGCKDITSPVRCAELYKEGMAKKILFAGGSGKGTEDKFEKSEAEIFRDIAIKNGVNKDDILIENQSTNTGDNFRFGLKILEKNNIDSKSIIIVHHVASERRTFSSARAIIKDRRLFITSPRMTFLKYLEFLKSEKDNGRETIEILLGDVQRIIVYPQFGWQVENEFPKDVLNAYNYIKDLGFTKFIIDKEKIDSLISEYGLVPGKERVYF